ncbi:MAG TPA: hypothetical protein VK404_01880 [Spirosoma sp.]|nr:hypothetical protein [Spirosoma sp.]
MVHQPAIKAQIVSLIQALSGYTGSDAIDKFAEGLANIIKSAILSADVTVTVNTAGSATAQTGTGTGSLS